MQHGGPRAEARCNPAAQRWWAVASRRPACPAATPPHDTPGHGRGMSLAKARWQHPATPPPNDRLRTPGGVARAVCWAFAKLPPKGLAWPMRRGGQRLSLANTRPGFRRARGELQPREPAFTPQQTRHTTRAGLPLGCRWVGTRQTERAGIAGGTTLNPLAGGPAGLSLWADAVPCESSRAPGSSPDAAGLSLGTPLPSRRPARAPATAPPHDAAGLSLREAHAPQQPRPPTDFIRAVPPAVKLETSLKL